MQRRIIGLVPGIGAWGLTVWLGACGILDKSEIKPLARTQPAVAVSDWPSVPVSAFRPATGGACPASYTLAHGACVHTAMRSRVSPAELEQQVAAYRAGAASPRVGGSRPGSMEPPQTAAALAADDPTKLPPDAFTKKRRDAGAVEAARIAELEALIRKARIRAGEKVDAEPSSEVDMMNPRAAHAETTLADTKKFSEMTAGLPLAVLKTLLQQISGTGGATLVSPQELQALQAQAERAEAEHATK